MAERSAPGGLHKLVPPEGGVEIPRSRLSEEGDGRMDPLLVPTPDPERDPRILRLGVQDLDEGRMAYPDHREVPVDRSEHGLEETCLGRNVGKEKGALCAVVCPLLHPKVGRLP